MIDFSGEIEQTQQAGVSHPLNLPFLFEPQQAKGQAVLLIHGFGASPYEMRPLGEALCQQGYLVLGVRLAGHGTTPEDLRACSWQDWLISVQQGYQFLRQNAVTINVIGQSTGALLGLALTRQPLSKLVLLSPFLKLRHPLAKMAGWLKYLIPYQHRQLPDPQRQHYYERRPLAGVEQIERLRRHIEPMLADISLPTLILAAAGDQTVAPGTGRKLFLKLGSSQKRFHLLGASVPHVLSTEENPQFVETCQLIEEFLGNS